ncbi:MAG: U32 family peptidase [Lachnospiraceae bacterium]
MHNKSVELLAPAGNYQSFIGAINAGADAVYLGGDKFGARAFAENFDTDTLCGCIRYAHLFGKRVYLTLNTLVKEEEFSDIYEYVKPFYLAGLDGVIIQDLGVLTYLRKHFEGMQLHASTQMAVTGKAMVDICKQEGICRVVPARELSLQELKEIKESGIEVEAFIHGAMCYCYSGMCLMSSVLGGRSGNRGKCAQPCRLPYDVEIDGKTQKNTYTLSLKDMCTIEHIKELIEAGIDSFKIEGRMKRSEYAAGVTALYRKYIDLYMENPNTLVRISGHDKKVLEQLYMRSELQEGYLFKSNGKDMITKDKPSYDQVDDAILQEIKQKYLMNPLKKKVFMYAQFGLGQKAAITLNCEDGYSVTIYGEETMPASNKPATIETVQKQLEKLGNTHFILEDIYVELDEGVFLPNATLNKLRRDAVVALEEEIISSLFPELSERSLKAQESVNEKKKAKVETSFQVIVKTKEQLEQVTTHRISKKIKVCFVEHILFSELVDEPLANWPILGLALPHIVRNKDHNQILEIAQSAIDKGISKFLVRNIESLALLQTLRGHARIEIITDANIYAWNRQALQTLEKYADAVTLPYELGQKERKSLKKVDTVQVAYGYIPLMLSANCVFKTNLNCKSFGQTLVREANLKDRYDKVFRVLTDCKYCYNQMLNSVPLSLHNKLEPQQAGELRLQFSIETSQEVKAVLDYYSMWESGAKNLCFPCKEFTTVHENRRVE